MSYWTELFSKVTRSLFTPITVMFTDTQRTNGIIMKILNCTPHNCQLHSKDAIVTYPVTGIVPRIQLRQEVLNESPRIVRTIYGEMVGLPDEEPDTLYIVSRIVATASPHRYDLLVPVDLIRDGGSRVIGCRAFGAIN